MPRKTPGRATRQIISGSQLSATRRTEPPPPAADPDTIVSWFFIGLAILVIAAALLWAIWGMGAATPIIFILAVGLIASWIVI